MCWCQAWINDGYTNNLEQENNINMDCEAPKINGENVWKQAIHSNSELQSAKCRIGVVSVKEGGG